MDIVTIDKRSLGISFNDKGEAEIVVWAPLAEKMEVVLSDQTAIPLVKYELGYWKVTTDKIKPGDFYKYRINSEKERPDPASVSQPEGVHGASQALDLENFNWTDSSWNNIPLEEYIIYELHAGTFTTESTFAGIAQKLDYLKELGINAIEIMPVAQFPGNRNWGYDGVYPFAVQNSYGGAKELQQLVNLCHEKGLAVILDVVYNHLGPEGNYLGEYAPYFTNKYNTPWGKALNFDDAWCYGVRRYFIENALMWFRDFHIDALRMDAVHAIKDLSPDHILKEIKHYVNQLMLETGRKHYLIVECDLNDVRFINPLHENGYGMDAQWVDEFHHALRITTGQERSGYYGDFEGINHLVKSYKDAYVYDGIYSPGRLKNFGTKASRNSGHQFVVFSQNHDQVGNRMLGERTSQLVSFEMQKLMVGAVMVSPFLPMLFMGEEWSEPHPFLYFVSHSDSALIEGVRKGRKAEFAAFYDKGEAPDPQAEETFKQSQLQWHLLNEELHQAMFKYYQRVIALRKQHPVLKQLNRNQMELHCNEEQKTIVLYRWEGSHQLLTIMNFSTMNQLVMLPNYNANWQKLLDSADPLWKGPLASSQAVSDGAAIIVQPESFLIYSNTYV